MTERVLARESARSVCDVCGKFGSITMAEFDVVTCVRCARRLSVFEVLEHKYGTERAKELLA